MFRILFLITFAFQLQAGGNPEKVQENPQIVIEPDQTDIFAIPLDEDSQEQQEQVYNLEHPAKAK